MSICSVENCGRQVRARGLCVSHYNRLLAGKPLDPPFEPRQKSPADGKCTVPGCDHPHLARGLCAAHWKRDRLGMDMSAPVRANPRGPAEERFWKFVERGDGCWLWTGGTQGAYGAFWDGRKHVGAHVFAWRLAHDMQEVPEGQYVLHDCDTPLCVRVGEGHVYGGTPAQNMLDKVQRGRCPRGSSHGKSKVTEEAVIKIREMSARGMTQKQIGEVFGIAQGTVGQIVRRKTWTHVR